MSLEPASDRFHRLVYQRMMATSDPQSKAWEYCQQTHKETFAAYRQEMAANEAATKEASKAADAARAKKQAVANDRAVQQQKIQSAVDKKLVLLGNDKPDSYSRAYNAVRRENPELFVEERSQEPAPTTWNLRDADGRPTLAGNA